MRPEAETAFEGFRIGQGREFFFDQIQIRRLEDFAPGDARDLLHHIISRRLADALQGGSLDGDGGFEGPAVFDAGHGESVLALFVGHEVAGEESPLLFATWLKSDRSDFAGG